jgi:hypothetical protein
VGNRADLYVHEGDAPGVYLYTHWDAESLPQVVHRGMVSRNARNRWNDAPYLTRILFEELIRGRERQETGYGISAQRSDGRLVKVDVAARTVTVGDREPVSFEDFIYNLHPTW